MVRFQLLLCLHSKQDFSGFYNKSYIPSHILFLKHCLFKPIFSCRWVLSLLEVVGSREQGMEYQLLKSLLPTHPDLGFLISHSFLGIVMAVEHRGTRGVFVVVVVYIGQRNLMCPILFPSDSYSLPLIGSAFYSLGNVLLCHNSG